MNNKKQIRKTLLKIRDAKLRQVVYIERLIDLAEKKETNVQDLRVHVARLVEVFV